jgi:hypothetical protein
LVVQLHHELVEVAEVEDDRNATLRVNLDAVEKQAIDQRPARLSRVVPDPVSGRELNGVAPYQTRSEVSGVTSSSTSASRPV